MLVLNKLSISEKLFLIMMAYPFYVLYDLMHYILLWIFVSMFISFRFDKFY